MYVSHRTVAFLEVESKERVVRGSRANERWLERHGTNVEGGEKEGESERVRESEQVWSYA